MPPLVVAGTVNVENSYDFIQNGLSLSQTINAGQSDNRLLLVGVATRNDAILSVEVAGSDISANRLFQGGGSGAETAVYYMLNPPVGESNLSVSIDGGNNRMAVAVLVLSGARQEAPGAHDPLENSSFNNAAFSHSFTFTDARVGDMSVSFLSDRSGIFGTMSLAASQPSQNLASALYA